MTSAGPTGSTARKLLPAALLARGALLLLDRLRERGEPLPHAVVTNDWVAGLVAPYAQHPGWAGTAASGVSTLGESTLFVHLIHNLEPGYDGKLVLDAPATQLTALHQLPHRLLHEGGGRKGGSHEPNLDTISLTRAALLCSCAWATVSASYRDELLASSSYAPLLRAAGGAIACNSGLPLGRRRAELAAHGDHATAKATLQRRCFGESGVRSSVPLFLFLGRVSYQKGVHLLLDCVPAILQAARGQLQLCVCGHADPSDAYARRCAAQMATLQVRSPRLAY